ncbi:MAG TPA: hypothetical protein VJM51_02350 [Dehalococcoidia bacterium]|nr:hypothetical protein [Dehalococcoidia bacterium]
MSARKGKLLEGEVDRIVVAQAEDDSAWEDPISVSRATSKSLSIPAELAARAAFLARLHREASVEKWLTNVIRERVELEEAAYAGAKRDLAEKSDASSAAHLT